MKYLLFLLLTINCYSDVLRLTLDSRLNETQRFTAARVQALYNTYVTDRCLPPIDNTLNVTVAVVPIDGRSEILAQTFANTWTQNSLGKYVLQNSARIELDIDDVNLWSQATLSEVLTHELAHCFGFQAIIWPSNGLTYFGRYVGPKALAAYRQEYDPFGQFVPTDDSHFDEIFMPLDLMSPVLNGNYISKTFWGVLEDNGNIISPYVKSGYLASILPRRPFEIIIITTNP